MHPEQLLLTIVKIIDNQKQITAKNRSIVIPQDRFEEKGHDLDDVATAMGYLQDNDHYIEVLRWPSKKSSPAFAKAVNTSIAILKQEGLKLNYDYHLRTLPKFSGSIAYYERKVKSELPQVTKKVGLFTLHEDGTVSYDDMPLRLQPKHAKLTAILIEGYPAIVRSEKLRDAYWEKEIQSDSEKLDNKDADKTMAAVHDAISKVRKILTSCDTRQHIKNEPRTGYRFIV